MIGTHSLGTNSLLASLQMVWVAEDDVLVKMRSLLEQPALVR